MCDQGQLYKVSKSKDGIVNKEKLTQHWTDWVDYWVVDFDYMQRKEIIKVPRESGVGENVFGNQAQLQLGVKSSTRSAGPAAISLRTNGRVSALARTAAWN